MSLSGWIGVFLPAGVFVGFVLYALLPRHTDRGDSQ